MIKCIENPQSFQNKLTICVPTFYELGINSYNGQCLAMFFFGNINIMWRLCCPEKASKSTYTSPKNSELLTE